jgi:membrane protein YqaA with SNARE-associated domain
MWRRLVIGLLIATLFVGSGLLFASIPTETIIAYVGIERAPLLMFLLGVIGGMSTFTGIPYHLVLMGLAAGGATPWLLGVATAAGVMVGDSTTYALSRQAKQVVSGRLASWLTDVSHVLARHPRLLTPALVLYGTISPFSNDFVVASLTLMGISYRRIIIPLTIGNMLYNITLAYVGYYAYETVVSFFS